MSRSTCLGAVPRSPPVIAGGSGSGASLVSPLAWKASAPTMPFTLLRAAHSGSARPTPAAEAKGPERSRMRGTSVREKNRLARSQRGARGGSQRRLTGRHRTEDLATLRIGLWTQRPPRGDRLCAPDGSWRLRTVARPGGRGWMGSSVADARQAALSEQLDGVGVDEVGCVGGGVRTRGLWCAASHRWTALAWPWTLTRMGKLVR